MAKKIDIIAIQSKVWLDPEEAAAYACITRRQIDIFRLHGTPHAGTLIYSKIGKTVLVKRTDLDKFLIKHSVKPIAI